jgi:hypothetical protein
MIETIGFKSTRWMQLKRQELTTRIEAQQQRGGATIPTCLVRQPSRLQHAISSLSTTSELQKRQQGQTNDKSISQCRNAEMPAQVGPKDNIVSSSSDGSSDGNDHKKDEASSVYHDYDAMPLPDPKLDEAEQNASSSETAAEEYEDLDCKPAAVVTTDSSSSDDANQTDESPAHKKRKTVSDSQALGSNGDEMASAATKSRPLMIASRGGIPHNVVPVPVINKDSLPNGSDRFALAPAVALPPFAGLGKRSKSGTKYPTQATKPDPTSSVGNGTALISADAESSSVSSETSRSPRISAHFHINEDDMIMMDDVLMCPFVFRSSDAVLCGALSESIMPGMLRAHFSSRNKLASIEIVYDSMGFMQQLERANGNEGVAQIVPGSLEMALTPSSTEARIITLAASPFLIVNVNDLWTRTTGYTQMEVEGKAYLTLLDGEATLPSKSEQPDKRSYDLDEVAKGRSACTTNVHYDKAGKDFIEFVCSYPLTK